MKVKTQKGITLLALVITIGILLILAAILVGSIRNEGLITKTQATTNSFDELYQKDQNLLGNLIKDQLNGNDGNGGNNSNNFKSYTIGDIVYINGEGFYVIKNSSSSEEMVTLLAMKNINTSTLVQSSSANTIAFSATQYWPEPEDQYGGDIIEATTPPASTHYAAYYAYRYGAKLGGTGRLLTEAEASLLYPAPYYLGIFDVASWLGTATIAGEGGYLWNTGHARMWMTSYATSDLCGVRPVVTISKSKLDTSSSGITNTLNVVNNTVNTIVY